MSARGRILLIDDDEAVRLRLRDVLEREQNYDIRERSDGRAGLAEALAAPPDLVLLDLMMPGLTGFEVCAALRADLRTREVPVIVLSSAGDSEAMVAALDAGADDFLPKPFSAAELRAKVRTITRLNRFRSLAGERDRFRWLLDHSQEPLIIADPAGRLVYANRPARELFDFSAGEGSDVAAALSQHFQSEPAGVLATWQTQGLPSGSTFTLAQPATAQVAARWFLVELHALEGGGGQTLMKFTNRTGAVSRELEAFTFQHLITHKIRTPLNGLTPVLEYLEAVEGDADPEKAEMVRLACVSAHRLEGSLLAVLRYHEAMFARPAAMPAEMTWRSLSEVVSVAAQTVGLADRMATGALTGSVAQSEMLEVVLGELFGNYAKFSDARRSGVQVAWASTGEQWELRLFAAGPGLPPNVIARLGQPYAQLERNFSGEVPGMGLGLATARTLLRARGGDLVFSGGHAATGLVSTVVLPSHLVQPAE